MLSDGLNKLILEAISLKLIQKAIRFMQFQMAIALIGASATGTVVVTNLGLYYLTAPFVPDKQEELYLQRVTRYSPPMIGCGIYLFVTLVVTSLLQDAISERELEDRCKQIGAKDDR